MKQLICAGLLAFAGLGLHAGWVWVMLVAHELTQPVNASPLRFLLSQFDGFVGWLVMAWTILMGICLWWFYAGRVGRARPTLSV